MTIDAIPLTVQADNGTLLPSDSGDITPDIWTFNDVDNQEIDTLIFSDYNSCTGISSSAQISVSGAAGAEFNVTDTVWTSTPSTINNGDWFQVRLTSSGSFEDELIANLTIGTVTVPWSVTTRASASDSTPDPIAGLFTNSNVTAGNEGYSNSITLTGFNTATSVDISGGGTPEWRKNGGTWSGVSGTAVVGDQIQLRNVASATPTNTTDTTLTLDGTVSGTWTITAIAAGSYSMKEITVDSLGLPTGTAYQDFPPDSGDFDQFTYTWQTMTVDDSIVASGSQSYRLSIVAGEGKTGQGITISEPGRNILDRPYFQYQWKQYLEPGSRWDVVYGPISDLKFLGFKNRPNGTTVANWIKINAAGTVLKMEAEGPYGSNNYTMNKQAAGGSYIEEGVWQTFTLQWNWAAEEDYFENTDPPPSNAPRFQLWGAGGGMGATSVLITDSWLDQPNNYPAVWPTAGLTANQNEGGAEWQFIANWNGGPPQSQSVWFDDMFFTDSDNPLPFVDGVPVVL